MQFKNSTQAVQFYLECRRLGFANGAKLRSWVHQPGYIPDAPQLEDFYIATLDVEKILSGFAEWERKVILKRASGSPADALEGLPGSQATKYRTVAEIRARFGQALKAADYLEPLEGQKPSPSPFTPKTGIEIIEAAAWELITKYGRMPTKMMVKSRSKYSRRHVRRHWEVVENLWQKYEKKMKDAQTIRTEGGQESLRKTETMPSLIE